MRRHNSFMTAILILVLSITFGCCGCGRKEEVIPVTEPTLEVAKDGTLTAYLVESFEKEYYSLAELDTMVRTEVAEYAATEGLDTKEGKEDIAVQSVEMAQDGSKQVVVALKFADSAIYEDYFGLKAFYGTVAQAVAEGYDLSAALTDAESGELFTSDMINKNKKKKILIIEDSVVVRCPDKVLYIGTNAMLREDGFVDCTESEGLKLIIMK